MIPISEIDSLLEEIERLVNAFRQPDTAYQYLEKLRHKAIPAIPISKIDEKVNSLEVGNNYCYECGVDYQEYAREILEDLKNENWMQKL